MTAMRRVHRRSTRLLAARRPTIAACHVHRARRAHSPDSSSRAFSSRRSRPAAACRTHGRGKDAGSCRCTAQRNARQASVTMGRSTRPPAGQRGSALPVGVMTTLAFVWAPHSPVTAASATAEPVEPRWSSVNVRHARHERRYRRSAQNRTPWNSSSDSVAEALASPSI